MLGARGSGNRADVRLQVLALFPSSCWAPRRWWHHLSTLGAGAWEVPAAQMEKATAMVREVLKAVAQKIIKRGMKT